MTAKQLSATEVEQAAAKAEAAAMGYFKQGLNCGECVFQGYLDQKMTDLPPEVVALASGMGGGMGFTKHTCGAVNAGLLVIGSRHGRKNPLAKATFEERVEELHRPETGIYPRHDAYIRRCLAEWGTIDCRDLCFPFDETTPEGKKERARNCKKIIGWCAAEATKAALSK